jgi:16S rRNA processing protein RimM
VSSESSGEGQNPDRPTRKSVLATVSQEKAAQACEPLVELGVVVRPHGIYGEFTVKLFNPESNVIRRQKEVVLRTDAATRTVQITGYRPVKKGYGLLRVDGCDSKESAEAFRGASVCVPRKSLPALSKDEYYFADLAGLTAILSTGEPLGEIQQVIAYPAADVLLVRATDGSVEVPMLQPYLVKVDVSAGHVVVDHIEDLERLRPKKGRTSK